MSFAGRIGLLAPSSNTTVEPEFYRALPEGVTLHTARLPITTVTPESIGKMADSLDVESKMLASADVDVIILGATAPSFLKGLGYDRDAIPNMCAGDHNVNRVAGSIQNARHYTHRAGLGL